MHDQVLDTRASLGGQLGQLVKLRESILVLLVVVVGACVALINPSFLHASNLKQVTLSATLIGIVALGEAVVMITKCIDLSVGAIVALSAFSTASWLQHHPNSIVLGYLLGCGVGLGLGAFNAFLVAVARVPAIIATLGTLAMYRGGALTFAGGRQIAAGSLPSSYQSITSRSVFGVPDLIVIAIALTVVIGLVMRYTRTGRNVYAIGSSLEGALFAGISQRRPVAFAYMLSGLLAGLTGVLWGARFGTVDGLTATGLELQVISAAVIGGVSIFGGSGTVLGALLGTLVLAELQNGSELLHVNQFWLNAIYGAAILGAVLLYTVLSRRLAGTPGATAGRASKLGRRPGKIMGTV